MTVSLTRGAAGKLHSKKPELTTLHCRFSLAYHASLLANVLLMGSAASGAALAILFVLAQFLIRTKRFATLTAFVLIALLIHRSCLLFEKCELKPGPNR